MHVHGITFVYVFIIFVNHKHIQNHSHAITFVYHYVCILFVNHKHVQKLVQSDVLMYRFYYLDYYSYIYEQNDAIENNEQTYGPDNLH